MKSPPTDELQCQLSREYFVTRKGCCARVKVKTAPKAYATLKKQYQEFKKHLSKQNTPLQNTLLKNVLKIPLPTLSPCGLGVFFFH